MRTLLLAALAAVLMAGCDSGGDVGGPGADQIRDTLEQKYRADLQEMVDWMGSMRGDEGRQAALAAEGVSAPSEILVSDLQVQRMRALSNGDFVAKVVYVKRNGSLEMSKTARITLTQVRGDWKVIGMEML
jgi:hypothetical protein